MHFFSQPSFLLFLADAILVIHVGFVIFVVMGLAIIFLGRAMNWRWVRNFWLRLAHLIAIGIVVLQSWAGVICPLTIWEMALRDKAGVSTYSGSFVQYWLQTILYYDAPNWVFMMLYTAFGALVLASWYFVRPNSRSS